MMREFGIQPTIKHYGCMVDLGRAWYLEEVEQLVTMMPIKADKVLWGSILSAARAQGNVGLSQSQWECHSSVMIIKFADVANFL